MNLDSRILVSFVTEMSTLKIYKTKDYKPINISKTIKKKCKLKKMWYFVILIHLKCFRFNRIYQNNTKMYIFGVNVSKLLFLSYSS